MRQDYRGIEDLLQASPPLQKALELKRVPDYSTLSRAFKQTKPDGLDRMLTSCLRKTGVAQSEAAVDTTGFQVGTASAYYQARSGKKARSWAKLSAAVLIPSLMVASAHASWGPSNDKSTFKVTMAPAASRVQISDLYADAGYDAEWIHRWCRGRRGIRSWIPPVVHSPSGNVGGYWRGEMVDGLSKNYGRRWGIEAFNSVVKRKWGAQTTARTKRGQLREILLKTVVYQIHR
jgi:hypothetical protein